MTVQIPTNFGLLNWRQVVELDGTAYGLTFNINRRDGFWRMSIDSDGTVLVSSVKLVQAKDLLIANKHDLRLPQGTMRMVDSDGLNAEATEANFGDRVVLVYDEVSA